VAILAGLAGALLVFAVAGGGITSPTKRIEQVTSPAGVDSSSGSAQIRLSVVKTAWPRIEENPVVGTGLDTSDSVVNVLAGGQVRPYQTHGAPLAVWYGAGIFGLIGFLVVFASLFRTGWASLGRASERDDVLVSWALIAAAAAFLLFTMAVPFAFQQYGWFAATMLIAWSACRERAVAGVPGLAAAVERRALGLGEPATP
jgi:O-antigen ligase